MRSVAQWALPLLLWIATLAVAQQPGGQLDQDGAFDSLLLAARQAQNTRDYAAAAGYYKHAVLLRSNMPELWANLGLMQDATRDYPDAIESFRKAVQLKPSLYVPNLFLGIDYLHLHRAGQAIPFLLKAEAMNPSDPQAALSLGRAYRSANNLEAASAAYRRVTVLDPSNSSAWFASGVVALDVIEAAGRRLSTEGANSTYARALFAESLEEQSRFKEALTEQKAVLSADPDFPCVHARLGLLYLAEKQDDDANREFAAASQSCALAALGQARLRIEAADDAQAVALLDGLWKRDPGFVRFNGSLLTEGLVEARATAFSAYLDQRNNARTISRSLYASLSASLNGAPQPADTPSLISDTKSPETGTGRDAAKIADHAERYQRCASDLDFRLTGESPRDLQLLAGCAFMTGDYALSARAADQLAVKSPNDLAAPYWSVKANEKLALAAFGRFEQLEPASERTHLLLGDMYRQRQHLQQAESEYKAAATLAPTDPAPLFGLASAYSEDSKTDDALKTAKTALSLSPDDPDLNLLAGELLVESRQWAPAEAYLNRSLSSKHPIKPQMLPHLHLLLGEVYEQTGRTQEAISQLQMGLSSDEEGTAYYRLARIYSKMGDKTAAQAAIEHVKALQQQRRERAVVALEDSSAADRDVP